MAIILFWLQNPCEMYTSEFYQNIHWFSYRIGTDETESHILTKLYDGIEYHRVKQW